VLDNFESCNAEALNTYGGDLSIRYAALKLAGLREAPCHLAVFADRQTGTGHGLGRRTMPEMAEYSTVAAVFLLWLAARAEGIGMGWVSILEPVAITAALDLPADWRFIGYFCLGYPQMENDSPELERLGWEQRRTGRRQHSAPLTAPIAEPAACRGSWTRSIENAPQE